MVLVVPEQSQRPYRFGMTLLCVGALFNWLGLADTYSEPVPAIRYIGVGLIAAGASLICMAMCFWMRNIHDPNMNNEFDVPSNPVHVITIDPSLEKPPDYSTVVDVPPCYEDAIKLNNSTSKVVAVHTLKHVTTTTTTASTVTAASNETPTNDLSDKHVPADRDNSPQFAACQAYDNPDFAPQTMTTVTSECRGGNEKCDVESSQNSASQSENALAKVLRKSIRGIRKLRSVGDDNVVGNASAGQGSAALENVHVVDRAVITTETNTGKVDR